jgi:hypothetical protein
MNSGGGGVEGEVEGEGEVEVEKMRGKKNHAMGVIECTYYFGESK